MIERLLSPIRVNPDLPPGIPRVAAPLLALFIAAAYVFGQVGGPGTGGSWWFVFENRTPEESTLSLWTREEDDGSVSMGRATNYVPPCSSSVLTVPRETSQWTVHVHGVRVLDPRSAPHPSEAEATDDISILIVLRSGYRPRIMAVWVGDSPRRADPHSDDCAAAQ